MLERKWTAGVDIGRETIQVSYMTDGMKEPETLEEVFPAGEYTVCLQKCLLAIPGLTEPENLNSLEIVLDELTLESAEGIRKACGEIGIAGSSVHLQGREEAAIYFALSQERSLWNNDVVFFDFSKEGLVYRNLHVERGSTGITAKVISEGLPEIDFNAPSDEVFLCLARERMERRIISAVYLIGEGFYGEEWAAESLKYLCSRRRVFKGLNLYTRGAAYAAYDRVNSHAFGQVRFICKNCLRASVGIRICCRGEHRLLYLVREGMNWLDARALIEAIPDGISELTIVLQKQGNEQEERISLEEFPDRGRRMTRLEICLAFQDEAHGIFTVRDLGFGNFVPASDTVVRKDIRI